MRIPLATRPPARPPPPIDPALAYSGFKPELPEVTFSVTKIFDRKISCSSGDQKALLFC